MADPIPPDPQRPQAPNTAWVKPVTSLPRLDSVLVTRPEPEVSRWVSDLSAHGWNARAVPLLEMAEPEDAESLARLRHWRTHWTTQDAVFFVSGAAAVHFFQGVSADAAANTPSTRCWAPGPGTARTVALCLGERGLSRMAVDAPPVDAAQYDSEHLWAVVAEQVRPGRRVLLVRGSSDDTTTETPGDASAPPSRWPGSGRDWLMQRCEAAGAEVSVCVAYRRTAPRWTAEQQAWARSGRSGGHVWLFSSSESLRHWAVCWGGQPPRSLEATALVTHPRMTERVRQLGFDRVLSVRPTLPDVLARLESDWSRS